ncbi:MAG: B12-binding domain-containing radical SAM protein [Planctomycetes bacterium]|nr:B12-binding domain-containing radical SAM protein [Planctomycetota bacterium]
MRVVFALPPPLSPTYIPLGLATLAPYVRHRAPGTSLEILDLNLQSWIRAARDEAGGEALFAFFRGREGDFYDEATYAAHLETWRRIGIRVASFAGEAKRAASGAAASPDAIDLLDAHADAILARDPELIGFSCFSLAQIPVSVAIAARIRERSRSRASGCAPRIILGGAATSFASADDLLRACPSIDGIVAGEGELGAAALACGEDPARVPGLRFRDGAGIRRNPFPQTVSMRDLFPPDLSALPLSEYWNPTPVVSALFSRGCAWRRCRFCAHNKSFAGYRKKAADRFVSEIEDAAERYGARHVYFSDQYIEAADLEAIAREILHRGLEVRWHVMGRPTAAHTTERLAVLFEAGCRWISWGVETGSARLLETIGKETDAPTIRRVITDAAAAGISNLPMMIFGLPTSTDRDLRDTLDFIDDVRPHIDDMTASTFVLYEGTAFANAPARYGMAVSGHNILFEAGGIPIREARLLFREFAEDGSLRPPRGPYEVGAWERRKEWIGGFGLLEHLSPEHYLLFVSRRADASRRPMTPQPRAA